MADSVELLLDPPSEVVLLEDWAALEAAGLPNQSRHQSFSNAPHVTLAAAGRIDDSYDDRLAAAAQGDPVELIIGGFLVFPTRRRYVLARQVIPGAALTGLHHRVWSALDGVADPVPTTIPGAWTPHITLGHGLTADQLAAALGVLRDRVPGRLRAGAIRRWDAHEKRLILLGDGCDGGDAGVGESGEVRAQ